jgi:hypothetical protein
MSEMIRLDEVEVVDGYIDQLMLLVKGGDRRKTALALATALWRVAREDSLNERRAAKVVALVVTTGREYEAVDKLHRAEKENHKHG